MKTPAKILDQWFYESPLERQWLKIRTVEVYMRKQPVVFEGRLFEKHITLANITQSAPGKGRVAEILVWMESKLPEVQGIFVENVISTRLAIILRRHGWREKHVDQLGLLSFHKLGSVKT